MKNGESEQEADSTETLASLSDFEETILKFYFIKPYRTRPNCRNIARRENTAVQIKTSENISSTKKSPFTAETKTVKSECELETMSPCKVSTSSDSSTITSLDSTAGCKSSKSVPHLEIPRSLESVGLFVPFTSETTIKSECKVKTMSSCNTSTSSDSSTITPLKSIADDKSSKPAPLLETPASLEYLNFSESYISSMKSSESTKSLEEFLIPTGHFPDLSGSVESLADPSVSDTCLMNPSASEPPLESSLLRSFASLNPSCSKLFCVKYAATTTILEPSASTTSFDKSAALTATPEEPSSYAETLTESSVLASSVAKSSESISFLMESSNSSVASDSSSGSLHPSVSNLSEKIAEYSTPVVKPAASALKMEHPSTSSASFAESSFFSSSVTKSCAPINAEVLPDISVAPSSSTSLNTDTIEPSRKLASETIASFVKPPEVPETNDEYVYSGGARPKNKHSLRSQNVPQPTVPTIEAEDNMTEIVNRFFLRCSPSELKRSKNKVFAEDCKLFEDEFADLLGIPHFNESQQNPNSDLNEIAINYKSIADRLKYENPFEKWNLDMKDNLATRSVSENFEDWTLDPDFHYTAEEFAENLPKADNENITEISETHSRISQDPLYNKMSAFIESLLKETHDVASPFSGEPSVFEVSSNKPRSPSPPSFNQELQDESQFSLDVLTLMKENGEDFSFNKVQSKVETVILRLVRKNLAEADISDEDFLLYFPSAMQFTDQEDKAEEKNPSDFSKEERILGIIYKFGYKNVAALYSEIKNTRGLKSSQKLDVKDIENEECKNIESRSIKASEEKPEDSRRDPRSAHDPETKFEDFDIMPVHTSRIGGESFGHYFNISSIQELNPLKNPNLLTSPLLNKNKAVSPLKQKILDTFDGIPTHTSPINLRDVLSGRRNSCSVTEESEIERDSSLDACVTNVSERTSYKKVLLPEFSSAYRRTPASVPPSESVISTDVSTIWTHKVSSGRSKLLEIIQSLKEGEDMTSSEVEEVIGPFEPVNDRDSAHNVARRESQSRPAQDIEETNVPNLVTKTSFDISSEENIFEGKGLQTITNEHACQMDSSVIVCDRIEMSKKVTKSHCDPQNMDEASGLDMASGETSNQSCVKALDVFQTFTSELKSRHHAYSISTSQTTETTIKWFTEERTAKGEEKKVFNPMDPERLETKQVNSVSFKLDTSAKDVWETDKSFTFYKELNDKEGKSD